MRQLILSLCLLLAAAGARAEQATQVVLTTNQGDITLALYADKAPKTVQNFLAYVRSGFYSDTVFHRVIKGFMIQGGGMTEDLQRKPTEAPIDNEADNGLLNLKYSIAMARTSDPHSATSQFFINTVDNDFLDHKDKSSRGWGYCVFGKVVEGQAVVDAIGATETGTVPPHRDVPKQAVIIQSARVVE